MGNIIPNIFGRHNAVTPNPAQNTSQDTSKVSNIAVPPPSSYSADGRKKRSPKKKRSKKRSLKKKRT